MTSAKHMLHLHACVRAQQYNQLAARIPELPRDGIELVNGLLTYDPAKRLTAGKALVHPHFATAPLPKEEDLMPTFPAVHAQPAGACLCAHLCACV